MIKGQKFDSMMYLKDLHVSNKNIDNIEPLIFMSTDLFSSTYTELGHTDNVRIKINTANADQNESDLIN